MKTLFYKIPPHLPFSKKRKLPLFGKEGPPVCVPRTGRGEIFAVDVNSILRPLICLPYYGLLSKCRFVNGGFGKGGCFLG